MEVQQHRSNTFDRVTNVITVLFVVATIGLSITLSVFELSIDAASNSD